MNNKLVGFISFIVGAAAGAFGAHLYLKEKYHKESQDKVEEALELVRKLRNKKPPAEVLAERMKQEESIDIPPIPGEGREEYEQAMSYNKVYQVPEKVEPKVDLNPKSPRSYYVQDIDIGDLDDYEIVHWTYYQDGVIADEDDREISLMELEESVPQGILSRFATEDIDSLYVRNDVFKCEYEILVDERTYEEVVGEKPYLKDE